MYWQFIKTSVQKTTCVPAVEKFRPAWL